MTPMTDAEALAAIRDAYYADNDTSMHREQMESAVAHLTRRLAAARGLAEAVAAHESAKAGWDALSFDSVDGALDTLEHAENALLAALTAWQQSEKEDGDGK